MKEPLFRTTTEHVKLRSKGNKGLKEFFFLNGMLLRQTVEGKMTDLTALLEHLNQFFELFKKTILLFIIYDHVSAPFNVVPPVMVPVIADHWPDENIRTKRWER